MADTLLHARTWSARPAAAVPLRCRTGSGRRAPRATRARRSELSAQAAPARASARRVTRLSSSWRRSRSPSRSAGSTRLGPARSTTSCPSMHEVAARRAPASRARTRAADSTAVVVHDWSSGPDQVELGGGACQQARSRRWGRATRSRRHAALRPVEVDDEVGEAGRLRAQGAAEGRGRAGVARGRGSPGATGLGGRTGVLADEPVDAAGGRRVDPRSSSRSSSASDRARRVSAACSTQASSARCVGRSPRSGRCVSRSSDIVRVVERAVVSARRVAGSAAPAAAPLGHGTTLGTAHAGRPGVLHRESARVSGGPVLAHGRTGIGSHREMRRHNDVSPHGPHGEESDNRMSASLEQSRIDVMKAAAAAVAPPPRRGRGRSGGNGPGDMRGVPPRLLPARRDRGPAGPPGPRSSRRSPPST